MTEPLVLTESRANAFIITLNEPSRRNPLSDPMIEALTAALKSDGARQASLVVLQGAGGTFSAGGDIKQFHDSLTSDATEQLDATSAFADLLTTLEQMPAITMAAVRGGAFGGGCGLTALCDIAIAAATAQFGCPEIRLGAFPMMITPALVRAIGPRATAALSVSGEKISAERARELGLVFTVVDDDEFDNHLARYIERAGKVPAHVLRLGKMSIRAGETSDYRVGLEAGAVLRSILFSSSAFHEGVNAFVDRAASRS
jgi:enoyl-CoA hydratase/carnithine racemase